MDSLPTVNIVIAVVICGIIVFLLIPYLFDAIRSKVYFKLNSNRHAGPGVKQGMIYDSETDTVLSDHAPIV